MKKFAVLIVAAIFGLSMFVASAPADAQGRRSIRGTIDVQFNMGVIFGTGVAENPDTNISYIGDIEFGEQNYTLVWFNVVPPTEGCTLCYAEDTWSIYDSAVYEFGVVDGVPGVLTSFMPGNLVLAGSDRAVGTSAGYWMGWGPVTQVAATADAPFDRMTRGRVFWHGSYDTDEIGPGTRFQGRFTVFPSFRH